jgi:hypothetical protein
VPTKAKAGALLFTFSPNEKSSLLIALTCVANYEVGGGCCRVQERKREVMLV